jgi:hypothetical protein
MFPKLIGPFLFQGLCGTLRETFDSRLRSAQGHVNQVPQPEILSGNLSEIADRLKAQLTADPIRLGADQPEMLGDPVEKVVNGFGSKRVMYMRFLLRFEGPEQYFKMLPGTDGPFIRIPASVSPEGFILEVITSDLNVGQIQQLLSNTRRELEIMIEEVNFLVGHYNDRLGGVLYDLLEKRRANIQETATFKDALPFPRYSAPKPKAMPTPPSTRRVFLSYSHEDKPLLDHLLDHLSQLKREKFIAVWNDEEIPAGGEIDPTILRELETADIILLLVSSAFMRSQYIWREEVSRAMKRHESGSAKVIPIILRPCDWHTAPFAKVKALPKDGKPVTLWPNQDLAFTDIALQLRRLVTPVAAH